MALGCEFPAPSTRWAVGFAKGSCICRSQKLFWEAPDIQIYQFHQEYFPLITLLGLKPLPSLKEWHHGVEAKTQASSFIPNGDNNYLYYKALRFLLPWRLS
jgi:hypothetical protein